MPCIADHIIDIPESHYNAAGVTRMHSCDIFDPLKVKENDLIFVKTDFIINGSFGAHLLKRIKNKFSLITGVSCLQLGRDDDNRYMNILNDSKLNKWFCVHPPEYQHEKIIPLPIGFQEPDRPGGNQKFLENMNITRMDFDKKEDKIFLPYHNLSTNVKRKEQFEYLASLPFVNAQREKQNLIQYYSSLNKHKFVIGLEGAGPDIHRNYETMLVGSIPINVKNCIQNLFSHHRLDGVFLDNWQELNKNLFDKLLSSCYNTYNNNKFLYIDYQRQYIKKILLKD